MEAPLSTVPGLPAGLDEPDGAHLMVGETCPGARMSSMETPWTPALAIPSPPTKTWILGSVEPEFTAGSGERSSWPLLVGALAITIERAFKSSRANVSEKVTD